MFKNLRWIIVFLLFMVYMINYLDRVALSITVPITTLLLARAALFRKRMSKEPVPEEVSSGRDRGN